MIIAISFSKTAHAGLVSFVNSIFGGESASAKTNFSTNSHNSANSQNIALLQPAVNIDPNPDKSIDTIPISNNDTLIPDLASSNSAKADTSSLEISTYTVRQGDTISGVAKMFKVSVNTVLWANNLTSKSTLKVGQTLVILPISGISYTIKKGDTIQGIANRHKADVNDILNYNDITISSPIIAGQTLIIPDGEMSSVATVQSQPGISTKLKDAAGYFIRPIVGGRKSQGIHGHNAVDLAAPVGTPILASAAGTVIIAKYNGEWNGGYGNYIVISHQNGTQTLYSHLSKESVSIGQTVSQGQTIGTIGMTGRTTGPHLHFEIRGAKNPF